MLVKGGYLILGNWKMHGDMRSVSALAQAVSRSAASAGENVSVGVAPAFPHLAPVKQALSAHVLLGAQDCRAEDSGAHTGDVSAAMLRDIGCGFVITGHSERRAEHGEGSATVRRKAGAVIRQGMHAVVCIGETLEEREAGDCLRVVEERLRDSLPAAFDRDTLTVSYEPVWAIGTGKAATPEDIMQMHGHIREVLRSLVGQADAAVPRILYGGSVKANNALDILALPVVDGVLVGGASLDADAFGAIIHAARTAAQQR